MRTTPTAAGLRARKKLETRRALENAALQLFLDKGYDDVTTEEIAEAAGVSSRTFFRYFASKEEVAILPWLEVAEHLESALAQRPVTEPLLESLAGAMLDTAEVVASDPPQLLQRVELLRATPALVTEVVRLVENMRAVLIRYAARRLGVDPKRDLRASVAAAWAIAGLMAARDVWLYGGPDRELRPLMEEAYRLLSGNLAAVLAR
jgi:AcrR family transcriptional regulator